MSSVICRVASWYGFLTRSYYSFKILRDGRAFEGEKGRRRSLRGGLEAVLKQRQKEEDVKEALQFWVLFALLYLYEYYVEFLFTWLPLYYFVKFVGLLYIISPRARGALLIYEYLEPKIASRLWWVEKVMIPSITARIAALVIRINSSFLTTNEEALKFSSPETLDVLEAKARECLFVVQREKALRKMNGASPSQSAMEPREPPQSPPRPSVKQESVKSLLSSTPSGVLTSLLENGRSLSGMLFSSFQAKSENSNVVIVQMEEEVEHSKSPSPQNDYVLVNEAIKPASPSAVPHPSFYPTRGVLAPRRTIDTRFVQGLQNADEPHEEEKDRLLDQLESREAEEHARFPWSQGQSPLRSQGQSPLQSQGQSPLRLQEKSPLRPPRRTPPRDDELPPLQFEDEEESFENSIPSSPEPRGPVTRSRAKKQWR